MKPPLGVCKNKVGCSLAYTGEKIPVPADSKCPECGQPLSIISQKQGGTKIVLVPVVLLLLIGVASGTAFFVFKDQLFHFALTKAETRQETKGVIQAPSDEQVAATPSNSSTDASTPDSATANAEKTQAGPTGTPLPALPSDNVASEKPQAVPPQTSPPPVPSESATPNQVVTRSAPPAATGDEAQPPGTLSKTEVDATREDVLKRINAMPKFTAEEKKRLSEKMETARSMERLLVIRFDTGQTALSRAAADDMMKRLKSSEVEDKLSDPTVVFVVAGYADAAGDPKKNLQLSQQRADSVTKILKDKTNLLNVVHSVGMGSTDLLDSKRLDQNRAVEIWAVAP
ncbi:MAG TPA: OmpA family protein [Chthoniobacterales bacterium]|jgi:outer membrane protein OmpA-like peptidoglycan-associated protein